MCLWSSITVDAIFKNSIILFEKLLALLVATFIIYGTAFIIPTLRRSIWKWRHHIRFHSTLLWNELFQLIIFLLYDGPEYFPSHNDHHSVVSFWKSDTFLLTPLMNLVQFHLTWYFHLKVFQQLQTCFSFQQWHKHTHHWIIIPSVAVVECALSTMPLDQHKLVWICVCYHWRLYTISALSFTVSAEIVTFNFSRLPVLFFL